MDIAVDLAHDTHSLVDPSGFTSFRVTIAGARGGDAVDEAMMAQVVAELGALVAESDAAHVWLTAVGIRELAGEAADAEWEDGFSAMVAFADSKGWVRDGAVRAHLELI